VESSTGFWLQTFLKNLPSPEEGSLMHLAVPNGVPHIFPYAHYITKASGRRGAAREVCEMILKVQGLWEGVAEWYFK
jgi:3-deoxy-D-manno-octulosonate 8-phosphate phosphatase KdsC-like HAD superfamily phosphatase